VSDVHWSQQYLTFDNSAEWPETLQYILDRLDEVIQIRAPAADSTSDMRR
jgi:hypothetical protein